MEDSNIQGTSRWMEGDGSQSDIVISSRIRLARNLKGLPFPCHMTENQQTEVLERVAGAVSSPGVTSAVGNLKIYPLRELSLLERQMLVEKHLISRELSEAEGIQAVVLRRDEAVSIMVNEEDHLRIQCLLSGLNLNEAWQLANTVDDALENEMDFAFDINKGYLTACPTNVGTGLRASTMLHMPALVITKQAAPILTALTKVGVAVRGIYGEGTETHGNIFQVSNQVTLGNSEEEIINNLIAVTNRLVDQERETREHLFKQNRWQIEDRVGRSYGILTNARILNPQETWQLLSDVRLGVEMKILEPIDRVRLNKMLVNIQPASLQLSVGKSLTPFQRDVHRANVVRELIGNSI